LGPTPEGRYFDDLPVGEQDVRQPEAAPDQPAIAEKLPQRLGMGVGSDVEILGHSAEHQVADRTAHQVALVARGPQPIEDLQSVRVDAGARDGVLGPRSDAGS
jgi:hypothetical protein